MLRQIQEEKITGHQCRTIVKAYGVASTKELTTEQVADARRKIEVVMEQKTA